MPPGYRDCRFISVNHLTGGSIKQLRAQLGNDIAINAFGRESCRFRTALSSPRFIGMKFRRTKTIKCWPAAFPAPASNLLLPGPPRMFNSWSRTQKSTPRLAAGGSPTSRTANLATRRCTKRASPATCLPKIATSSSRITHRRPEPNGIVSLCTKDEASACPGKVDAGFPKRTCANVKCRAYPVPFERNTLL